MPIQNVTRQNHQTIAHKLQPTKIAVIGLGYVGLSNSILLAQKHQVIAVDVLKERVEQVNLRICPISDNYMQKFLTEVELNLKAITDVHSAICGAEFIILCVPTNYDEITNSFDTNELEKLIKLCVAHEPNAQIVVKSTVPIGFIDRVRNDNRTPQIMFSPEFLREGSALEDNLRPSRIIVGSKTPAANKFAQMLRECASIDALDIPLIFTDPNEAESIKLFSNTYLAMRISFINELDNFAIANGLDTSSIIKGISTDPRIGEYYNNPPFGYGGYCLPKDSKQLLANFADVPQNLISATVMSNKNRIRFLSEQILKLKPKVVGLFKVSMI